LVFASLGTALVLIAYAFLFSSILQSRKSRYERARAESVQTWLRLTDEINRRKLQRVFDLAVQGLDLPLGDESAKAMRTILLQHVREISASSDESSNLDILTSAQVQRSDSVRDIPVSESEQ